MREFNVAADADTGTSAAVPTGLRGVDDVMPLHRGALYVVAGVSSMGKTTFLVSVALGALSEGARVVLISCRESGYAMEVRLAAARARVDRPHSFPVQVSPAVTDGMRRASGELAREPLLLMAEPLPTVYELQETLRPAGGVDLVLLDDLEALEAPDLPAAAASLRWLARWLRVPMVATLGAALPSRDGFMPRLSDLPRGVVRAADVCAALDRPSYFQRPPEKLAGAARKQWDERTIGRVLWDRRGFARAFEMELRYREGPRFS